MVSVPAAGSLVRVSDTQLLVTFTPTWTNLTIGSGADNQGWYQQVGAMILWGVRVEFGTSPSYSATITLNAPVNAYTGGGGSLAASVGSWNFRAATAGTTNYAGSVITNASDGSTFRFAGAWNGTNPANTVGLGTNVPITPVVAGTVFAASGCYRAS